MIDCQFCSELDQFSPAMEPIAWDARDRPVWFECPVCGALCKVHPDKLLPGEIGWLEWVTEPVRIEQVMVGQI